jgi:dihydroxy-acid dehydratase
MVDKPELDRRRAEGQALRDDPPRRGYSRLYQEQILQADEGCDFGFLRAQ